MSLVTNEPAVRAIPAFDNHPCTAVAGCLVRNRWGCLCWRTAWLIRDETWVDAYLADPRCGFTPSAELFVNLVEDTRRAGKPDNVAHIRAELPVLISSGEADPLAANIASVAEQ